MERNESDIVNAKPLPKEEYPPIPFEEHKRQMERLYERTKDRFYREGFEEGKLWAERN